MAQMTYRPLVRTAHEVSMLQRRGQQKRYESEYGKAAVYELGTPPIVRQPWECLATLEFEVWIWSDGTLRAAPEAAVVGSPNDRDWVVTF